MEGNFYLVMDCYPSDYPVISVPFERKNENPCMVFPAGDPLSKPAFVGDGEIHWLNSDEYYLSLLDKRFRNGKVKPRGVMPFIQSKDCIDLIPFRKRHRVGRLLSGELEFETRKNYHKKVNV
jgi:hypothetical protein